MPFALKAKIEPARFFWGKGRDEWVDLKAITASELKAIRKKCVSPKVEYYVPDDAPKGQQPFRYEFEHFDREQFDRLFWDAQIVAWRVVDESGAEIECTTENKLLLLENSNEFSTWVVKNLEKLEQDLKKRVEKSEKN